MIKELARSKRRILSDKAPELLSNLKISLEEIRESLVKINNSRIMYLLIKEGNLMSEDHRNSNLITNEYLQQKIKRQ